MSLRAVIGSLKYKISVHKFAEGRVKKRHVDFQAFFPMPCFYQGTI